LVRVGNWPTAEEGEKLLSTESRDNLAVVVTVLSSRFLLDVACEVLR